MRNRKLLTVLVLGTFLLVFLGCGKPKEQRAKDAEKSSKKPEEKVVGKWIGDGETIEFFKEGTVSVSDGMFGQPANGDYRFIDKDRIRLDLGGALALLGPIIFQIELSGDDLKLIDTSGKVYEYRKARAETTKVAKLTRLDKMESEMRINLAAIRTCEEAYKAVHGVYLACGPSGAYNSAEPVPWDPGPGFDNIGFEPDGMVRYTYEVIVAEATKSTAYTATAKGDVDGDYNEAVWTINQDTATPAGNGNH